MSALSFLFDPGMAPFTGAFALVSGLVLIELVMMAVGASLIGDGDAPDFDADAGLDADAGFDADADLGDFDADGGFDHGHSDVHLDIEFAPETDVGGGPDISPGIAGWLGFGQVPFIIWLAGILTAFGLSGYVLQVGFSSVFDGLLHPLLASAIALIPGLRLGGMVARGLGRMVPKTETTAISLRSLGNRRGVVVQGTARRGSPAQARIRDGHGNLHYVRVEPVDEGVEIPRGTEILTRSSRGPVLGAIPLDD